MSYQNFRDQVDLLLDILEIVLSDKRLALKGGTAINMFLQDMPRLSVDIDLCFLPITDRESFISEWTSIADNLSKNLLRLGGVSITIPKTRDGYPKHIRVLRNHHIVKVEINWVIRGSVYEPSKRSLSANAVKEFKKSASVQVLSFEDVYAGKICAALDRQHPRDLFDIMYFFNTHDFTERLKKAFIVYLISGNRPLSEMINPNKLNQRDLFEREFVGMTGQHVTYDELEIARNMLTNTINQTLNNNDREFLLSLKRGEPIWGLLDVDGIENMPAVRWKLKNIQLMETTQRNKALEALKRKLEV